MYVIATHRFSSFTISSQAAPQGIVVSIHGALSAEAAGRLQVVLDGILNGCDVRDIGVRIDVHDVLGVDFDGVAALARVTEWADQHGARITLIDPPELLCQALEVGGLTGLIRMVREERRPRVSTSNMDRRQAQVKHPAGRQRLLEKSDLGTHAAP